jgi:hypothetical protein
MFTNLKEFAMKNVFTFGIIALLAVAFAGCTSKTGESGSDGEASKYLFNERPANAVEVAEVVKSAGDNDEVTIVGRIGGSRNPWVEDVAAFDIVDPDLTPCNEREGDNCPTPWDYCCDLNDLKTSTAMIKVVDAEGQPVEKDARKLFGVKELQTVVAHGKVQKNEDGRFVVLADRIYIAP